MLVLGTIAVFGAIVFLVLGILWREESPVAARMAALRGESPIASLAAPAPAESITLRVLGPLGLAIAGKLRTILPVTLIQSIDYRLVQAGQPVTTSGFLFAVVLVEAALMAFAATIIAAAGLQPKIALVVVGLVILGLFLPRIWLENRVRHRQKEILRSLPDAFDLITVCVEAGLGLDAALAKVAEKVEGPFAEELYLALREVSLGKLRRDALKEMGARTGVPDLIAFINAVVQAETMGTSIANVLRVQAEQMRTLRRQRAEQQAYKAPVKMVFPLVLCIFPTLFLVILGPAGITIFDTLGK